MRGPCVGRLIAEHGGEEIPIDVPPELFDRRLVRRRRERAAGRAAPLDYLVRHASELLAERIQDVRRRFELGLAIGCHPEPLAAARAAQIGQLIHLDPSEAMARRQGRPAMVADEEALPLAPGRLDLVLACGTLHWVNDLPGTLIQIARALRPDGLLLAAVPGGDTLRELREVLLHAEVETRGGAGLRVAPFADVREMGALLQRAGFALPVVDVETVRVTFDHPLGLLRELRLMGQGSALRERGRVMLGRPALARAVALYQERFALPGGRVPATFQFVMLSGWRPDPSQPEPRRRGSALRSLAEELRGPIANPPGTRSSTSRS